ncbi:MAG TPA: hypothetical protein VF594_10805 [Rubricoccaceae bacterium]|jgi:hypothetical protein
MLRLSLLALLVGLAAPAASAQIGIGGLVPDPTGLTLKVGAGRGAFTVDLDLDNTLGVQAHYLIRERRVGTGATDARVWFGPGAFLYDTEPDVAAGVSAAFGASVYLAREFEIFGQLVPRVLLTPDTDFDVAPAVGVRFYP